MIKTTLELVAVVMGAAATANAVDMSECTEVTVGTDVTKECDEDCDTIRSELDYLQDGYYPEHEVRGIHIVNNEGSDWGSGYSATFTFLFGNRNDKYPYSASSSGTHEIRCEDKC